MSGEAASILPSGPSLVIRADASPDIGGGHVTRTLCLADRLRGLGWSCCLATRAATLEMADLPDWLDVLELTCDSDHEPADMTRRWPAGADLLIVDHYGRTRDWERACRPWARRLAVLDDWPARPHDCDLLLDQNGGREKSAYLSLVPEGCQLLTGPAYALLRPDFALTRPTALERRRHPGRRLLISLGAADPLNLGGRILEALKDEGGQLDIDLVCGASVEHVDPLRKLAESMPGTAVIHGRVADMAGLMLRADLAIGACGSSSWERCALGLPALGLSLSENQLPLASFLAQAGAILDLGQPSEETPVIAARAALDLLADPTAMRDMAHLASAICDGLGADRLARLCDLWPRPGDLESGA